jgi:oxaloacetate decarboxylase alpha subunit
MGRYKVISKESRGLIEGNYGKTPGTIDPELLKTVCGDKERITVRPADLLEPEWEKLKEEVKDKATKDEDVIIFALFPQIAEQYLEKRGTPPDEVFKKVDAPAATAKSAEPSNMFRVKVNGKSYDVQVDEMGAVESAAPATASPAPEAAPAASGGDGQPVPAPLAGSIWKVNCAVGDSVSEGDVIVILEAMKMETEVVSPFSGSVKSIAVKQGDKVNPGDTLLTIG